MSEEDERNKTCGCGHPAHEGRCPEWRRYPEVLEARQCGCRGMRT